MPFIPSFISFTCLENVWLVVVKFMARVVVKVFGKRCWINKMWLLSSFHLAIFIKPISNCELSIMLFTTSMMHSFVTMTIEKTIHIKPMDEVGVVMKYITSWKYFKVLIEKLKVCYSVIFPVILIYAFCLDFYFRKAFSAWVSWSIHFVFLDTSV